MSREDFKRLVTADQPEAPDYFVHDAVLNRKERASLDSAMQRTLRPLPLPEVLSLEAAGAQLLDVRDGIDFEGGHLRGALNIALGGKYATWAGSLLDAARPIVVIAEEGGEEEAVMRLGRIGFDNVAGYLAGGMNALAARDDSIKRTPRITAHALAGWLSGKRPELGPAPTVVDVRSDAERAGGQIAGSMHIPLSHLHDRFGEIPAGKPVVVHCEGGYRSPIAASLLQKLRHPGVHDLVGGYKAWAAADSPASGRDPT
ncbi:MAG: rhodanese-like domain-containing protein [Planctomycetia bacterium]